jgi:hypothetical protein
VQAWNFVRTDAASGVRFGVGRRELRASGVGVGAVSRQTPPVFYLQPLSTSFHYYPD